MSYVFGYLQALALDNVYFTYWLRQRKWVCLIWLVETHLMPDTFVAHFYVADARRETGRPPHVFVVNNATAAYNDGGI